MDLLAQLDRRETRAVTVTTVYPGDLDQRESLECLERMEPPA